MTVSVNGTTGITFNDASTQNTAATGFGFKNRIINGAMVIDQRNAGASVTPTVGGVYLLDRYIFSLSQSSKYSVQQNAGSVTPPTGFTNYLGITSLSAYTVGSSELFLFTQSIEGFNTADLAWGTASASPVTLSFWVRSSLTGTFGGTVSNSGDTRVYPFTYTISAANTWEYKTITIAGDTSGTWLTNNGIGMNVRIGLGVGSSLSGTAGAWTGSTVYSATGATSVVGTNGATFYITGVQLEKGSTATSFDYRPYGTELNLCYRYFQTFVKNASASFGTGFYYSSSIYHQPVRFQQQMRTTPSLVIVNGTNFYKVEKAGGNDSLNGFLLARENEWGGLLYNTTEASGTGGQAWESVTDNASAYIGFSAEL
jgi:hypothetical protein